MKSGRFNWLGIAAALAVAAAATFAAVWTGVRAADTTPQVAASNAAALMTHDPWTTAGSAGALVDESDLNYYAVKGAVAQIAGGAPDSVNVVLRYNVTAAPGLVNRLDGWQMALRYRDNGGDARVTAKLKAYNISSGNTLTLLSFDSNDEDRNRDFQVAVVGDCVPEFIFNFASNTYYIEVTLERSGSGGKPAIGGIQIGAVDCP